MAQYVTDFAENAVGSTPSDWTHRWEGSPSDWEVFDFPAAAILTDYITNRPLLRHTNATAPGNRALSWDAPGSTEDGDLLYLCYAPTSDASLRMRGILRGAGTGTGGSGYWGELTGFSGYDRGVSKLVTGTFTNLDNDGSTGFLAASTLYWVRVNVVGTTIRTKMWANGGAEPGSWLLSETDSDINAAGWVGLGGRTWTRYLHVAVGTGADVAPVQPTAPGRPFGAFPPPGDIASLGWSLAAHPNGASVQYEGELRPDGGSWQSLFSLQSSNSYDWNTAGLTGGTYELRVRAHDGSGYGNWSAVGEATLVDPPPEVLPRPFVEIVEVAQTWATWRANRATEWKLYHALQDIWDPDPASLVGTFPPGTEWIIAEAAAGEVNYFTLTRIVPDGRELVFLRRVVDLTAAVDPEVGALWTTTDPGTPPQHARLDIGQASGGVFLRELHRGDDSEFEPGPENLIASYPVQVERMFVPTPPGGWFVVVDTNAGGSTASDAVQV
jgi:hypothetical protein